MQRLTQAPKKRGLSQKPRGKTCNVRTTPPAKQSQLSENKIKLSKDEQISEETETGSSKSSYNTSSDEINRRPVSRRKDDYHLRSQVFEQLNN